MPDTPRVAIQLVVKNGASWIRTVLDSVRAQTWPATEVLLLDYASDDGTADIVRTEYPEVRLFHGHTNKGVWQGTEQLLDESDAPFVLVLTDVVLDPTALEHGVRALLDRPDTGAVQAKIFQGIMAPAGMERSNVIDTVGFRIAPSLHITNLGHGERDEGQYDRLEEVFGVEGAAPLFRRTALDRCRINGHLVDPDYRVGGIGYGDDVDIAWRMQLFGFAQVFVPTMRAWHDRSTTKELARNWREALTRIRMRRRISLAKRRLDWANIRFTIIKNVRTETLVRQFPRFAVHELAVLGYMLLFEPAVFLEVPRFIRLFPRMYARRQLVQARAVRSAATLHTWFRIP